MKQSYFYVIPIIFLIVSCNALTKNNMRAFIPGIYVRVIDHEFAKGDDTLVITQLNDHTYQIVKRSGFRRILNGKPQPPEQQTETWTGTYDDKKKVIRTSGKGKLLTPLPKENKLLVEASFYDKINT